MHKMRRRRRRTRNKKEIERKSTSKIVYDLLATAMTYRNDNEEEELNESKL